MAHASLKWWLSDKHPAVVSRFVTDHWTDDIRGAAMLYDHLQANPNDEALNARYREAMKDVLCDQILRE